MTKKDKIKVLLERGVDEIITKKDLERKLNSGKKLRVKLGIDPTSPNLHVGRSIALLKMRDFQELGHQLVFIVGDATGVIGDTSDKESERPMLTKETVTKNMKNYAKQAGKIIDIKKCEVRYNSEWLDKLGYAEIGAQAELFSLHEFNRRENIKRRLDAGTRVSLRELLYPLMQGYDSVAVKADIELGGTDQRFNLLAGRTMQPYYKQAPQNIIMGPLLEGIDGRKMSSSWGNTINVNDEPDDMFGKAMSIPDSLVIKYLKLTTRLPITKIKQLEKDLEKGSNPKNVKMKLAFELVRFYHSESAAKKAEDYFTKTFSKKEVPNKMPEVKPSVYSLVTILLEAKLVSSKGEARRAIDQHGVKINGAKAVSTQDKVNKGDVVQKGKRYFVKVK